jgi:glycopeptide antibiotics resistance protein/uncharacterized RDD family membrane protein YckC
MDMDVYLIPIQTALILFPLLAAALTLPFALYQYHKYGAIPWIRTLVVFSFIFYMLAAYFLIILPLPDRSNTALFSFAKHFEPYPFNNLMEYVQKYGMPQNVHSVLAFLKSATFLQLAFNVLMLLPFGAYMRYYFRRSCLHTVLLSLGLSLFYEITQITALYGFYPAPYRTFDADDLICNTLGGLIGWIVAPGLLFFLPKREAIDAQAVKASQRVTLVRRICGTTVDAFLVGVMLTAVEVCLVLAHSPWASLSPWGIDLSFLSFFVFQWLCTVISHGYTPGKQLCRLRIVDENDQPPTFARLTLRYALIAAQLCGTQIFTVVARQLSDYVSSPLRTLLFFASLAGQLFCLWFYFELVRNFFSRKSRTFWYERVSKTHSISVYPVNAAAEK